MEKLSYIYSTWQYYYSLLFAVNLFLITLNNVTVPYFLLSDNLKILFLHKLVNVQYSMNVCTLAALLDSLRTSKDFTPNPNVNNEI